MPALLLATFSSNDFAVSEAQMDSSDTTHSAAIRVCFLVIKFAGFGLFLHCSNCAIDVRKQDQSLHFYLPTHPNFTPFL
jgi:hypothetical protein